MLMSYKWTRDHLDSVCDTNGHKSIKVKEICADVIVNTKKKIEDLTSSKDIVADIYPSYTIKTPNRIVFVITLKREVDESLIKENIPFATELRVLGCYSVEAKSVYKSEIVEPMSVKDQLKVKQCINMNCEELFKRHRYLSIITASNTRSRRFKTDTHIKEKQLCLVLFVHAKGFIPIDEDSFLEMYGEFAIDVLEGVFTPYVKTCKDYHDDVKIGCKISRGTICGGTLGGFIDHDKHGLVGLTCAHALLNETEFSCFANNVSNLVLDNWPKQYRDEEKRHVFQPDEIHSQAPLGQIVEAAYCPGGDNRSGVDAVLFRVEKRFPLSGGCPSVLKDDEIIDPAFSFETGKICGPLPYPDNIVTKFGAATELTNGLLEFEVPFVCVRTIDLLDMETDFFKIKLLNQYQVRVGPGGNLFANKGDSGALVFAKDLEKKNVCIGILEGGNITSQVTFVSPIQDVFEHFRIRNFKQFENEENAKQLVRMGQKIDELYAMKPSIVEIKESQQRIETMLIGHSQNQHNV